jgi:hypothetical protein
MSVNLKIAGALVVVLLAGRPAAEAAVALTRHAGQSDASFAAAARTWAPLDQSLREKLVRIIESYPGEVVGVEIGPHHTVLLKMRSGASVPFDDGKTRNHEQRLVECDVEDMLFDDYPRKLPVKWTTNLDPGRYRSAAFFKAVYGQTKAEVERGLVSVQFCEHHVRFSSHNGASKALEAVSREMDGVLARNPELKKYVTKLGGTFNWRSIAGSEALSAHSFGIAIDLNPQLGEYWLWSNASKEETTRRQAFPLEIVEAFEHNGFVWGGKWFHFDLMHFEYRPELIRPELVAKTESVSPSPPVLAKTTYSPNEQPAEAGALLKNSEDVAGLLFDAAFDVSPYQKYSTADKIGILRMVQARLAYEGFYGGPINGAYDDTTQRSIRDWQKEKAFAANGLLDSVTLGSIGLSDLPPGRGRVISKGAK